MNWTNEQLESHPKRDALLGRVAHNRKASDEAIQRAYSSTGNVWEAARLLGMCGQSVWERLTKMKAIIAVQFDHLQEKLIRDFYKTEFRRGELKIFCRGNGMLPTSVSRWAKHNGLRTSYSRSNTKETSMQLSDRMKKQWQRLPHPRGMLGKRHSPETLRKISAASLRSNASRTPKEKHKMALKAMQTRAVNGNLISPRPWASWKQGWHIIADKKYFFRSSWEFRYAQHLEMLKRGGAITGWEYEPTTFWFEGVKRGTTNYTPDFKVLFSNGVEEYHEVKGWMDNRSKTKLRRMKKYHPAICIKIISADWFKKHS